MSLPIDTLLDRAQQAGESDRETLAMILANRCDMATAAGALLSVSRFYEVADDILRWQERQDGGSEWVALADRGPAAEDFDDFKEIFAYHPKYGIHRANGLTKLGFEGFTHWRRTGIKKPPLPGEVSG